MTVTPAVPQTLEQKIELAAAEASQIVSIFSAPAAAAIQAGVAVEPVVSGFLQLIIALFKHHTSQTATSASAAAPVPVPASTQAPTTT